MPPEDRVRLQHMLDAANDAIEFARGQSRRSLDANRMLTLSIVKCIEIVGEAANHVSPTSQKHAQRFHGAMSSPCAIG